MFYFNLYIQSLYIFSNYKCPEAHFYLNRLINGRCCVDLEYYSIGHEIYFYLIISVNGCSILACQVVVLSTIYIIYKLTILRIKLQWTDSSITQKSYHLYYFFIVRLLAYTLGHLGIPNTLPLYIRLTDYNDIFLIIGFSTNFVIYLIISTQIRDKLRIGLVKLFLLFKCW